MTKQNRLTAATILTVTILTVLSLVVTIRSFIPATSNAAPHAAANAMSQPATTEIVPAPVIDPMAEVFIGAGDGSAGFWFKPQSSPRPPADHEIDRHSH